MVYAALAQIDQCLSNFLSFQPTVFINLEHEAVYRRSLLGIFILSLGIISYNYINILTRNIQPAYRQEYDVCEECNDYGVPYDCSSIMHYGAETFSTASGP